MRLSDGSVVPSFLDAFNSTDNHLGPSGSNNMVLRIGEVVAILYPSDSNNVSGKYTEYRVLVSERNGTSHGATRYYGNCYVGSLFGGVADFMTYTLRPSTQSDLNDFNVGLGSKVLLLCANGDEAQSIIIGGVRDSTSHPPNPDDSQDLGHHLDFVFNGVKGNINKDGEFSLIFNGATDPNGELKDGVDSSNSSAALQMAKDGTLNLSSPSNTTIKSKGLLVGDATDHTVLGDTYRQAEDQMLQSLSTGLSTVSTQLGVAGTSITLAGTGLIGLSNPSATALST